MRVVYLGFVIVGVYFLFFGFEKDEVEICCIIGIVNVVWFNILFVGVGIFK